MAQLANGNEVVTPTKADSALAKELSQKLAAHAGSALRLELKTGRSTEELVLRLRRYGLYCVPSLSWDKATP